MGKQKKEGVHMGRPSQQIIVGTGESSTTELRYEITSQKHSIKPLILAGYGKK